MQLHPVFVGMLAEVNELGLPFTQLDKIVPPFACVHPEHDVTCNKSYDNTGDKDYHKKQGGA